MRMQLLGMTCCLLWTASAMAQPAPEPDRIRLEQGLEELSTQLKSLGEVSAVQRDDAELCARAVRMILKHEEFFKPSYVKLADQVLDLGRQRVAALQSGQAVEHTQGRKALAYRSRIDDSLQPYSVGLPPGYADAQGKRWPLHLVLHGRNGSLTEVSFIAGAEGK
ncbi:MAG: hypothetical protein KDA58_13740, partial [Planctomycetaceae bacterium]|nr:hypothetical protein [Planctomycetaceae bacterium]